MGFITRQKTILVFLISLFAIVQLQAQDSTFVLRVKDVTTDSTKYYNTWQKIYHYFADANKESNKKFDISFIGGPHYSSDIKLGLGVVASGLYRTTADSLTSISNVSITGDVTTSGFYLLGIRGNNYFKADRWRIDYFIYFFSFPSAFWGLGYEAGDNDANASKYLRVQGLAKADVLYSPIKGLYFGPCLGFDFVSGTNFKRPELIMGNDSIFRAYNFGAMISYDSRDFIPNPYRGIYVTARQRNYTDFKGKPFFKTQFQFNGYQQLWKDGVLAYDLFTEFSYGATPWTMMAPIGGSNRMRGYYEGRYRDDNMVTTQLELRQKVWRRIGATGWVGAGNVWGQGGAFSWRHTLPNYGVGLRWEFKHRVNVRFDFGFGKRGQNSFLFGINEAF